LFDALCIVFVVAVCMPSTVILTAAPNEAESDMFGLRPWAEAVAASAEDEALLLATGDN
jgi:hypothetical protein